MKNGDPVAAERVSMKFRLFMEQLFGLITRFTGQTYAELAESGFVDGGEDNGGMGLAVAQFRELLKSLSRDGIQRGADGQSDQHFVGVQTGVMIAEVVCFEILNRLNHIGGDQQNLMIDSAEGLESIEQSGGRCAKQGRGFTRDDSSVRKLDGGSRHLGIFGSAQGGCNHRSVVNSDAGTAHEQFQLYNGRFLHAAKAKIALGMEITANDFLPGCFLTNLVVNDAVSCHIDPHVGGGLVRAGAGNFLRAKMNQHHLTLFLCTAASVALACIVYTIAFMALKSGFHISIHHQAGYICSMLFIIPGFPFITSGIDLAKLDMRSGLERLAYALIIIAVATLAAWMLALVLHLKPMDFLPLNLSKSEYLIFRLIASFFGVLGFSVMFNSPLQLAATAGIIGAIANTTRLELVDLASFPPAAAAFLGALLAGLLASMIKTSIGYPRISLTVPSIVIMVPGLYLYRAIYNIGITSINTGAFWFTEALLIIMALPLGLIFARIITDKTFRRCS